MRRSLAKVPVKGITAEEVLALWQEGKLYQVGERQQESEEELLKRCQRETLEYVASINEYATDEWRPYIRQIWEKVVHDDAFSTGLVMRQKRQMNRYFVTCLVYNLQVRGIYKPVKQVSQLELHLALEHVEKRNHISKGWGNYPVTSAQRRRLKALMGNFFDDAKD